MNGGHTDSQFLGYLPVGQALVCQVVGVGSDGSAAGLISFITLVPLQFRVGIMIMLPLPLAF